MTVFCAAVVVALVGLYAFDRRWQHLALAAVFSAQLALCLAVSRLVRGELGYESGSDASLLGPAAGLLIAGELVLWPVAALFLANFVVPLATVATSVSVATVALAGRRERRVLLWSLCLFAGAAVVVISVLPLPWARLSMALRFGAAARAGTVGAQLLGRVAPIVWRLIAIGAVGLVLWQLGLVHRQRLADGKLGSIRTRLAVTFIVLVVLVACAVSTLSIALQVRGNQQQAFLRLETTASLKAKAIGTWIEERKSALASLVVDNAAPGGASADDVALTLAVLLDSSTDEPEPTAARKLRRRFAGLIQRTGWFTEVFLLDREGTVALSTNSDLEGRSLASRLDLQAALRGPYVSPPTYDPMSGGLSMVFAQPLGRAGGAYSADTVVGILAARTDITAIRDIVTVTDAAMPGRAAVSVGDEEAGPQTYLVSTDRILLTSPGLAGGFVPVRSQGVEAVLMRPTRTGSGVYRSHRGGRVSGAWAWLPELQAGLIVEQSQAEVQSGVLVTSILSGAAGLAATLIATLFALRFAESIATPLAGLAAAAGRAARGDLVAAAEAIEATVVVRHDEIGAVGRAFNEMASQLDELVGDLEHRVLERTRRLHAVTEVSRATTSVLDLDELLPRVVDLAKQSFDLYYVGLFLLNEARDHAELRAGTGVAGAEMLARNWRLAVGGASMIGRCVLTGEAVIQQESGNQATEPGRTSGAVVATDAVVTASAVRFENPWLPETQSELALPLRYGDNVIGAMTVQSEKLGAFSDTDIAVLQNLADQVAVAVQNARLFAETQAALDRARRARRRFEQQAWNEYLRTRPITGYEQVGPDEAADVRPLGPALLDEVQSYLDSADATKRLGQRSPGAPSPTAPANGGDQLLVPITQGDQVVGVVGVQRDEALSEEDADLVRTVVEQLSLAAENQRLLDVTQRREARERQARQAASRMRAPVELEDVLRTAADEIRAALGADWVVVRLLEPSSEEQTPRPTEWPRSHVRPGWEPSRPAKAPNEERVHGDSA